MSNKEMNILTISAVFISVICLTVAFASLSKTLQISGTSTVKSSSWSIKFRNPINYNSSTNSKFKVGGEPVIVGNTVHFNSELSGLNEYIYFDLPIENEGTIDAVLSSINISKIGADSSKIKVTVTDLLNNEINNGDFELNKEFTSHLRVRVEVDPNLSSFDIANDSDVSVEIAFSFTQK